MGAKFSEEDLLELAPPKKKKTEPTKKDYIETPESVIFERENTVQDVHNVNDEHVEDKNPSHAESVDASKEDNKTLKINNNSPEDTYDNDKSDEYVQNSQAQTKENGVLLNPEVASDILNNNPMNIKFNYRTVSTGQGKKGQKVKRINMSFTDEIYLYISTESRKRGMSSSVFVNTIIAKFMKDNATFE